MEHTLKILRDLCLTPAPSGFEKEIAVKVRDYLSPHCDTIETDFLGNVIGKICGRDASLKPLLINAHMDRVGVIVSNILPNGFLKIEKIGWTNDKVLPGLTLAIRRKDRLGWITGVVGTKCAHLLSPEEQRMSQPISSLLVDVGADNAEQARTLGVEIGAPCVYMPHFSELHDGRVCATALDNCGCVAALIGIACELHDNRPMRDVYLAGNVWEEYNQRAAAVLAAKIRPVAVISMDMLLAGDTPDIGGSFCGSVGQGPMASCYNFCDRPCNGTIAHEGLYDLAEKVAAVRRTGLQRYVCVNSLGDNAYSQLAGDGPACIEIGAPVRYAHSSGEVADLHDIDALESLVAGMALEMGPDFQQARF
ncbi:MAG: hypothetical protein VB034_06975 [Eubacteriales bacterium]|nr:hypothetical protein [Eubacteriales bacterium]